MHTAKKLAVAALLAATSLSTAWAAPVTFFGEDVSSGSDLSSWPNSDAARNLFFGNLIGVGTETFESFAVNTSNPALTFPGAGTATLTGSGFVAAGADAAGRYPISGNQYYFASTGSTGVTFSAPVAAFGFYGIDIGDYGGHLTLTLTDTLSNTTVLTVPNQTSLAGQINGSVLYFGFYDTGAQYTSVTFGNDSNGSDAFAFDDMSVGSNQQVVPTPEPMTLALFGSGLAGLAALRRRRRG